LEKMIQQRRSEPTAAPAQVPTGPAAASARPQAPQAANSQRRAINFGGLLFVPEPNYISPNQNYATPENGNYNVPQFGNYNVPQFGNYVSPDKNYNSGRPQGNSMSGSAVPKSPSGGSSNSNYVRPTQQH
jgi:hypothetical protein